MCYWIRFVIAVHGGVGWTGGTLVYLLFCLTPSVNMAFFGLLASIVIQRPHALPILAAMWVAAERIPTPFNFMWLKLGDAGLNMGIPIRLAPFTGVYGLSFLFALMAAGLAWVILRRPRRDLFWLTLFALPFALPSLPEQTKSAESAVSVQPNIPEEKQWTRADVDALHERLGFLSLQAILAEPGKPRLILWPEAPAPLYYYDDPPFREQVVQLARATQATIVISTIAQNVKGDPMNSAVAITPSGDIAGRYDKIFPVPFGEYVPAPFGYFAGKVTDQIGDFAPGQRVSVLHSGVGTFICYESAFPHLVRQFAAAGATVFANLSNDGYFGRSAAREQHLALVRMRAIENRRYILRSTNDGITASVDPAGRVLETLPAYIETSGRLPFSFVTETTPYTRYGDWFAWLCVGISAVGLLLSQIPHYQRPRQKA
jgi:apolipoprotein N-acyltransferase